MRYQSLQNKVVVLTGASSGIGKLTAEEFLKKGANVVLAARSLEPMQAHLKQLGLDDRRAMAVRCDVSDAEQVRQLADKAVSHFGRIDIWVNNAGISLYGLMESFTPDEVSRVIDVNLKGEFYGSQEAVRIFKSQGYGNLINVSSALGQGSSPLQAAYTAAKHGIVGFSSALREELLNDPAYKGIDVSVVLPASMDTPLFRHAKSRLGTEPYPIPPIYHPMVSVKEIIRCAMHPKPRAAAGCAGMAIMLAYRLFPGLLERYMGKTAVGLQTQSGASQPESRKATETENNLFSPMPGIYGARGGIGTSREHMATYLKQHAPTVGLTLSAPLLLLGTAFLIRRKALS